MNYIKTKPERTISLSFAEVYYSGGKWYSLHLNGNGYYSILIDGRSVYSECKKKGLLSEYNILKTN
jgi:hypothetical protein